MNKTVVVVSGANRGLGLAFCRQLLQKEYYVIAGCRKPAEAKELLALHKRFEKTSQVIALDVASPESSKAFARKLEPLRAVDILINNAGILTGEGAGFKDTPLEDILSSFQVNTFGPLLLTRALLPLLKRSKMAKIAHITSKMGSIQDNSSGGYYAYRMSKAALNMFNKSFSIDFPEFTSAVFHPGWVQTDMGGKQAPLSVEKSVAGLIAQIEKLSPSQNGHFLDYEGKSVPW